MLNYLYYKSKKGNFGDDLNPWLWPQFFENKNAPNAPAFLGIGSILFNDFSLIKELDASQKKIVFGSGIRPQHQHLHTDETWDIRFVRGPLSAGSINYKAKHIADAAYAIRLTKGYEALKNKPKKYEVGLMPYFKSMHYFDWEKLCSQLGYKFISPHSENGVEATLNEIAECKYLITEAMHGAIVADILRVPWNRFILTTPFTEGGIVSEFKWFDWLYSIEKGDTDSTFIKFYRKSFLNKYILGFTNNMINAEFLIKSPVKNELLATLSAIKDFNLSEDKVIATIDMKFHDEIEKLKTDYNLGNPT